MKTKLLAALLLVSLLVSCDSFTPSRKPSSPGNSSSSSASSSLPDDVTYYMEEDLPSSYSFSDGSFSEDDGTLTITNTSGENLSYTLSSLSLSKIEVETDAAIELVLDNVTVSGKKNTITLSGSGTVFIKLIGTNTISSSKKGIKSEQNSVVIYSESDGSLSITSYEDGIKLDGGRLRMLSGSLSITVPEDAEEGDGIDAFAYVQDGGTVSVEALCSAKDEESKGIKAKGDDDSSVYSDPMGYIAINSGELTIKSYGKALTANWDYSEDGDGALDGENGTDPVASVFINGGTISITTIGTPVEEGEDPDDSSYSLSPEGIEAKQHMVINDGTVEISATDDAMNAGATLTINGGEIYAVSSENDAIDSNGTLEINGGKVIALGASAPEGGIDTDSDSNFTYTGGTLVAIGGDNSTPSSSATTGKAVTATASSTMAITTSSGDVVMAYTLPSSSYSGKSVLLASSELEKGSYRYVTGAAVTSTSDFHGLAEGDVTLSGGSSVSFTISSKVTAVKSGR